jgi:hypothetical protein
MLTNSVATLSANELYRPNDHRLSAKLVPTFADRGAVALSQRRIPYGRNLLQRVFMKSSRPLRIASSDQIYFPATFEYRIPFQSPLSSYVGNAYTSRSCVDQRKIMAHLIIKCRAQIELLERFQSKALRMRMDAPWYVPNTVIRRDLQIPTVKAEIRRYRSQYSARLNAHPNDLTVNLTELPDNRRLRRHLPNDLPTRFLV